MLSSKAKINAFHYLYYLANNRPDLIFFRTCRNQNPLCSSSLSCFENNHVEFFFSHKASFVLVNSSIDKSSLNCIINNFSHRNSADSSYFIKHQVNDKLCFNATQLSCVYVIFHIFHEDEGHMLIFVCLFLDLSLSRIK